jgi:hypothetical protein
MHDEFPSPIDGTPATSLRRVVWVVIAGFLLAFALNPESLGRWAYMLDDSTAVRPIQVAAGATSDAAAALWQCAGLPVPYDKLRDVSQRGRLIIGANR